jgi:hypothetical protein
MRSARLAIRSGFTLQVFTDECLSFHISGNTILTVALARRIALFLQSIRSLVSGHNTTKARGDHSADRTNSHTKAMRLGALTF